VWQDRRTTERCRQLAGQEARVNQITGLLVDPYFSATKLEWLLRDPRVASLAEAGQLAAGTVDSWLIWKLTNGAVHATDYTNASRTLLFDIDKREWSNELLKLFGVPRSILPEVRASAGDFGAAAAEHFGREIPIAGVAGDQQAALFGQACWTVGSSKNTYGTGAFLLLNAGGVRPAGAADGTRDGLLTTLACDAAGGAVYALEASIFIAGAALQWLRDGLQIINSAGESEELARSIDSTGGVAFVPALAGLGAPHWEPRARGLITGLSRGSGRAHLVRAALEAMAYGTRDVLDVMHQRFSAGTRGSAALRVDGGASANNWLMQFQSDVLQLPVERPESVETTALGAAGLAGLAANVWSDANKFGNALQFTRFEPDTTPGTQGAVADGYAEWQRAVRTAIYWASSYSPQPAGNL
jgi:glycerol kinase